MSAGAYDITIEQGSTFTLNLDYKDANDVLILVVGTLNDCRAQIRESHGGTLIAWGDTTGGVYPSDVTDSSTALKKITITVQDTSPNIKLEIANGVTNGYTFESAVYDIELYTATTVDRIMEGRVFLAKEVTI